MFAGASNWPLNLCNDERSRIVVTIRVYLAVLIPRLWEDLCLNLSETVHLFSPLSILRKGCMTIYRLPFQGESSVSIVIRIRWRWEQNVYHMIDLGA